MTTAESGSPNPNPVPAVESGSPNPNPVPVVEPGSPNISFLEKLIKLLEDWFFATLKPILLLLKNSIIFGVFLLIDHGFFSLITILSVEALKNQVVSQVFQDVDFVTAVVIVLAYVVRLCLELFHHREEFLGIPQRKMG